MASSSGISLGAPAGYTPQVTEFIGVLEELYKNAVDGNFGKKDVVFLQFGEVDYLLTSSPQIDDRFRVQINYSESATTVWDGFRKSLVQFMPDEAEGDILWFVGRKFHMAWSEMPTRRQNETTGKWENVTGHGWAVQAVEGLVNLGEVASSELQDAIVKDVIDNRNEADAVMAFHENAAIRSMLGYSDAMELVTNGTLHSTYAEKELVSMDNEGIWHTN